ncbi:unnamed protein product [Rotaria sordida]|uniref:Emopamil-binding protein n=1 Tax=Rotaria sordida TaxID=392033 RepID=A0A818QH43_9BILA|nr:unnamed protein product [Rotaria sordida]CAF1035178.1 unnamed protein product [Rotaria sordida]CAF3594073.1 unnamed protein product [Rotaria sordida]CAF3639073.1 unnamed protein product [Rotaria sordida]
MQSKSNVRFNQYSQCFMPHWATAWAIIGSLICIWDATYVIVRPRSMANGDLFHIFFPYAKYITLDPLYGNLQNAFVIAQSWMNYVEITFTLLSVIVYHVNGRRNLGCLILLIVSVMTWSKTVLYFIHDYFERPLHPQKLPIEIETWEYLFLFIIPSLIWVVLPFACMWNIGRQILNLLNEKIKSK